MTDLVNPSLLVSLLVLLTLWLASLSFFFIRSQKKLAKLTYGTSKKDLLSILEKLQKNSHQASQENKKLLRLLEQAQLEAKGHLQNIGFLRYNPFGDTGGDQSFCLCLLDRHGNGIVLSSLHSRDQTRIYAKKIKRGQSPGYTLSKEERAVIKQASRVNGTA